MDGMDAGDGRVLHEEEDVPELAVVHVTRAEQHAVLHKPNVVAVDGKVAAAYGGGK